MAAGAAASSDPINANPRTTVIDELPSHRWTPALRLTCRERRANWSIMERDGVVSARARQLRFLTNAKQLEPALVAGDNPLPVRRVLALLQGGIGGDHRAGGRACGVEQRKIC